MNQRPEKRKFQYQKNNQCKYNQTSDCSYRLRKVELSGQVDNLGSPLGFSDARLTDEMTRSVRTDPAIRADAAAVLAAIDELGDMTMATKRMSTVQVPVDFRLDTQ